MKENAAPADSISCNENLSKLTKIINYYSVVRDASTGINHFQRPEGPECSGKSIQGNYDLADRSSQPDNVTLFMSEDGGIHFRLSLNAEKS